MPKVKKWSSGIMERAKDRYPIHRNFIEMYLDMLTGVNQ